MTSMQHQGAETNKCTAMVSALTPADERLYRAYARDRDDGMTHDKIVADACYGALAEMFGQRYSALQSQYLDAMKQQRNANYGLEPSLPPRAEQSPDGRTYRPGE